MTTCVSIKNECSMIHKKIKIEYIYKWEVTYSTSLNSEMAIIGGTSGF